VVTATVPRRSKPTAARREGPGRCCSPSMPMANGSRFAKAGDGGTAYDWLSGPNKGYGFGSSGTPHRSMKEHRESIRAFLAMIDPNTAYIGGQLREACNPTEPYQTQTSAGARRRTGTTARSWPVQTSLGQRQ
jgi:hypothetical protein